VSDEQRPAGKSPAHDSSILLFFPAGHMFAAGYDIRTQEAYEESMASFDRIVGFKYLKGMHINDSQGGGLNCKKDRHDNIGL
jgi:endonuclease IV